MEYSGSDATVARMFKRLAYASNFPAVESPRIMVYMRISHKMVMCGLRLAFASIP